MTDSKTLCSALKALSDPIRLRIFRLLALHSTEICVCEFVDSLQERQYTVSKGIGQLQNAGLVVGNKDGRWVYYSLSEPSKNSNLLCEIVKGIDEQILEQDLHRFHARLSLRSEDKCRIGIGADDYNDETSEILTTRGSNN